MKWLAIIPLIAFAIFLGLLNLSVPVGVVTATPTPTPGPTATPAPSPSPTPTPSPSPTPTPTPTPVPTAPSGLSGAADSTVAITWSWTDNASDETGFKLYDASDDSLEATIATANTTSYQEAGLSENTTYQRYVVAYNDGGNSTQSNTASATTLTSNTAPTASTPGSISQATDGSGYVTFETEITDSDGDTTQIQVDYSLDNSTWYLAELASVSTSQGDASIDTSSDATYRVTSVDTDTGKVNVTITWDSKAAYPDQRESRVYLRVTPYDGTVAGSSSVSESFQVDNSSPNTSNFVLQSRTSTSMTLAWDAPTDTSGFSKYTLCFGTNSGHVSNCSNTAEVVTITDSTTETHTFTGLKKNTKHYAKLITTDTFGNATTLTLSNILTSDLPTLNLAVDSATTSNISLSWNKVATSFFSTYELCYDTIENKVSGKNCLGTKVSITDQNVITRTIDSLLSGITYYFQIKAIQTGNREEIASNVVTVTTCTDGQTFTNGKCLSSEESLLAPLTATTAPTLDSTPTPSPESALLSSSPSPSPSPAPEEDTEVEEEGSVIEVVRNTVEAIVEGVAATVETVIEKVQEIVEEFKEIVRELPQTSAKVVESLQKFPETPGKAVQEVQETLQPLVESDAAKATTSTAAAAATVALMSSQQVAFVALQNLGSQVAGIAQRLWQGVLGLAGIRGNRRPWGRVVDAKTGDPIKGAIVQILDHGSGRLRDTISVDDRGNFASYLPTGSYEFRVKKNGWKITPEAPFLKLLGGERVYDGSALTVDQEQVVPVVLAMRPIEKLSSTPVHIWKVVWQRINYFIGALSWPLLLLGAGLNTILVGVYPGVLNVSVQFFYVLLVILKALIIRRHYRATGSVTSKGTGESLDLALVRIYDAKTNNLVATRVTNGKGKFFLLVPEGVYTVTVSRKGYQQHRESHVVVRKADSAALSLSFALESVS